MTQQAASPATVGRKPSYRIPSFSRTRKDARLGASAPANFVVVGKTRVDVESEDAEAILKWVEGGGRLVIIDRVPPASLVPAAGGWRVSAEITEYPGQIGRAHV